jgi:hypothetical protein
MLDRAEDPDKSSFLNMRGTYREKSDDRGVHSLTVSGGICPRQKPNTHTRQKHRKQDDRLHPAGKIPNQQQGTYRRQEK